MPQFTCAIEGCDNTKREAKGMCRLHYRRSRPRTPDKPKLEACIVCGLETLRHSGGGRKYGRTCSTECRKRLTFGWSEPLPDDHWARWYGATCEWKPPRIDTAPSAAFCSGYCHDCGKSYTQPASWVQSYYCSSQCARRVGRRRRRARELGAFGEYNYIEVLRLYLKQGKTCAYCRQEVDGLPEPEHVIPLSRGGRNDVTNLVAACGPCNRDKRDLTLDEWELDRARRGLNPVRTHLDDECFKHLVKGSTVRQSWADRSAA